MPRRRKRDRRTATSRPPPPVVAVATMSIIVPSSMSDRAGSPEGRRGYSVPDAIERPFATTIARNTTQPDVRSRRRRNGQPPRRMTNCSNHWKGRNAN
jgi:hypothetical protein